MQLIVGLGNPGKEYELTRHNAGFLTVDALAKQLSLNWTTNKKFKAEEAKGLDVILIKPLTFMNESGTAVAAALACYRLTPAELAIIHDDLDIELGKYKISTDSRSAGHKGVQSIIDRLKTKNFRRIRIGIKTPADSARRNEVEAAKFVLQKFKAPELKIIKNLIAALEKIIFPA